MRDDCVSAPLPDRAVRRLCPVVLGTYSYSGLALPRSVSEKTGRSQTIAPRPAALCPAAHPAGLHAGTDARWIRPRPGQGSMAFHAGGTHAHASIIGQDVYVSNASTGFDQSVNTYAVPIEFANAVECCVPLNGFADARRAHTGPHCFVDGQGTLSACVEFQVQEAQ